MSNAKNLGQTLYFSQFGGERSIPEAFVAAMERVEERTSGYAIDAELPEPDADVVEQRFDTSERRTNEKVLVVIRKKPGNITLSDFRTTDQGLSVQVNATLFYTTDTTFVRAYPSVTQDVAIKDLGNGWSIQEVAVNGTFGEGGVFTASPFSRDSYTKERLNLIPEKFRGLVPTLRTRIAENGQATIPTLGVGELLRSEEDLNAFRKLVEVLTINDLSFPIDIIDTAVITEYGGGPVNITSRLALVNTLTVEQGEEIVSSKVTKLGEGHELRETVTRQNAEWPILPFSRFNARLQLVESGTKQVVAKGATATAYPTGISGNNIIETREIDGYREEQIITAKPIAVVDAYKRVIYGNRTNVDVPPQLESLNGIIDRDGGAGSYSENGSYSLTGSNGNASLQLHGSTQASASALPELTPVVRMPRTRNIPCVHVLLFVPNGTAEGTIRTALASAIGGGITVQPWPDFRPQPITIRTVGGKGSLQAQVSVSAHDSISTDYLGAVKYNGTSRSKGAGISYETSRTTRTIQIPETIHGSLSIAGDSDLWTDFYAAQGVINAGNAGYADSAAIIPTITAVRSRGIITIVSSTGGTTGTQSISAIDTSSKLYLHRMLVEPDSEYDREKVFAELVDFADIKP